MNFVFVVFELCDKMLTLSSMENLIVPCNLKRHVSQEARSSTTFGLWSSGGHFRLPFQSKKN